MRESTDSAAETAVTVGVHLDAGLVTHFYVHHVVFVHIDHRLHVREIRHAHDFRAGELIRGYDPLA